MPPKQPSPNSCPPERRATSQRRRAMASTSADFRSSLASQACASSSPAAVARRAATRSLTSSSRDTEVTNGDLVPLGHGGVRRSPHRPHRRRAGVRRAVVVRRFDELEPGTGVPRYDAVVHFAAIPAILVRPDNETFRINALSTYNVIDAAVEAGDRQGRLRQLRDDVRHLFRRRRGASPSTCRSTRSTRPCPTTATRCRRSSTRRRHDRSRLARASTSTGCGSTT
jgi:hypothetical protein